MHVRRHAALGRAVVKVVAAGAWREGRAGGRGWADNPAGRCGGAGTESGAALRCTTVRWNCRKVGQGNGMGEAPCGSVGSPLNVLVPPPSARSGSSIRQRCSFEKAQAGWICAWQSTSFARGYGSPNNRWQCVCTAVQAGRKRGGCVVQNEAGQGPRSVVCGGARWANELALNGAGIQRWGGCGGGCEVV